ncbi:LysR family transcriptional regulator [Klebsiella pneumoniae]|uniref:LysR family transcriptional regulator n=1 Tax=Klebsiella pneumoniae TaxID=573 RepID=UPI0015E4A1E9|nr:LysR family transcriptional regulator [Klebsiella pneumoniae]QLO22085.1 LysR family transcriptional regulator [Klebsiella pneumoniae]
MDINKLSALRELALRKTMTEVAKKLHLSPSAVSQQIAQLEEEVGIDLIERRGRGVELTLAGERLVVHANRIFTELESARAEMSYLKKEVAGKIRVAAFPSVAAAVMPSTFTALGKLHQQLQVQFDEMEPEEALTALRGWQTDVALIDDLNTPPGLLDANIAIIPLMEDVFNVVLPLQHVLAEKKKVTFSELSDEKWVIDTASMTYTDMLSAACSKSGFMPDIIARCKGFEVTVELIRGGCGIAILPELRARKNLEGVVVRRVYPEIRRKIFVVYRKSEKKNPLIKAFLTSLCEQSAIIRYGALNPEMEELVQQLILD